MNPSTGDAHRPGPPAVLCSTTPPIVEVQPMPLDRATRIKRPERPRAVERVRPRIHLRPERNQPRVNRDPVDMRGTPQVHAGCRCPRPLNAAPRPPAGDPPPGPPGTPRRPPRVTRPPRPPR